MDRSYTCHPYIMSCAQELHIVLWTGAIYCLVDRGYACKLEGSTCFLPAGGIGCGRLPRPAVAVDLALRLAAEPLVLRRHLQHTEHIRLTRTCRHHVAHVDRSRSALDKGRLPHAFMTCVLISDFSTDNAAVFTLMHILVR